MKAQNLYALMAALAAVGEPPRPEKRYGYLAVTGIPPAKPLPKGCKDYWFNMHHEFRTDKMRRDEVIFHCHALNDKSAKKKFNKWLETQALSAPEDPIDDDYDENEFVDEICPACGRDYDQVDMEYQICHHCKHNNNPKP